MAYEFLEGVDLLPQIPGASAPSIAGLRAFVAVAELGHFGDAAAAARVSQPALSQALAALERNLGVALIERTTRRVLVTPDGQRLLPAARASLESLDALALLADSDREPLAGLVRIGVIPTVAPYLAPPMLRTLQKAVPAMLPEIHEDQTARLLEALSTGAIDVAILALPVGAAGVAEVPLYDEDFVLAVPAGHPLAGGEAIPLTSLVETRLLLLDEGHCLRDQALEVCGTVGAREAGSARAASLSTIVRLVEAGLGTTLLPATAVRAEGSAELGFARFRSPAPGRHIGVVYRASSPRAHEWNLLASHVRAAVSGVAEWSGGVRVSGAR
ncbi:MAG: LysR substrate-binding domain-containing protein [Actinobacteria bacterium]|nr:LysR substrate-binding domain-containing protein [Actinomycetota bacterium]